MTPAEGHPDDRGAPRHWLLVIALLAIYTYAFIDRVILALLVEPIRQDLGASDLQMGLLLGLGFAFFYAAFSIPAGHFVDRYDRRLMIGSASVFWALMTIFCGTATSMEQLFLGRAGVGIAESVIMPAAFSLIRDAVPARSRGLAFSLYAMGPLIGASTSLLLGGYLLGAANTGAFAGWPLLGDTAPWRATLMVTGLFGIPISALLLFVCEPQRPPVELGKEGHHDGFLAGFGAALRHMRGHLAIYLPLIAFVTFGAMANFSKSAWIPTIIGRTWQLPPQEAGPLLGAILLPTGVAGLILSGLVLNWLTVRGGDIRNYGAIAAAGTLVGLVGVGLAPSLTIALVMAGVGSFFLGTSYSVGASTLGQVTPVRLMGRVTAVYFLFQTMLGQALGPFIVAFGSERVFTGRTALAHSFALSCGIFCIAMLIAVFALRANLKKDVAGTT